MSCGCLGTYHPERRTLQIGDQFGKLTITGPNLENRNYKSYFCLCSCGKTISVPKDKLTAGHKSSCGHDGRSTIMTKCYRSLEDCLETRMKSALRRAAVNNWAFDLTVGVLLTKHEQQKGLCFFSGMKMEHAPGDYSISLDRRDSQRGYTCDNVVLTCSIINVMKRDLPEDKFILFCKMVSQKH